ncbi:MAG: hypothetical protein RLZZ15_522 [Verrucomicrobiota bacterium]|jgi:hypothetical protein
MPAAISAIEPYVQHIRDALWRTPVRGLASVMVGSGFSRNADPARPGARAFPVWDGLARSMAERIGLDQSDLPPKPRDPLQIAEMFCAMLGRAELHGLIERQVPDAEWNPGALHRRLLNLPWSDVFTTNYDTLLERTFSERNYRRIVSPKGLALTQSPRLVKLHGTLNTDGKLIATQEDYRRYPQTHAPFVNLVRQAVMETVFVLVGFSGDDPNFLEWIGWVRDILGEDAPKIYLCGVFEDSAATRALLASRRVTPIDLSAVAAHCTTGDRHAFALDWFFAALESGKPGRAVKWAPRESPSIERHPPLPAARRFTPFAGRPNHSPPQEFDVSQLKVAAVAWRAQREEYPGWHVAPDSVRERVWFGMSEWRAAAFFHSDKLSVADRILVAREVCWRLEVCLSPIFTDETDRLVSWLEALNPFGERLKLVAATVPNAVDLPALREAWVALALHVLRTAREDLDEERYRVWRDRLLAVGAGDPTLAGELHHEEVQRHLNRLDLPAFRAGLAAWRESATQPLELARLAALFAETGDNRVAEELAIRAMNAARAEHGTQASVALEAWCCVLLGALDWRDRKKSAEWRERIEVAKEQGYNPEETIALLTTELKAPRPQQMRSVERRAGFDVGEVRQTRRFSGHNSSEMAAWQLLRLLERAPCPIYTEHMGFFGKEAAYAAVWIGDGAPFWSLSMLLRAGAKPDVVDEAFDRAAIAILKPERVAQLFNQLLRMIDVEVAGLGVTAKAPTDALGQRILETALDLLSRLALRLGRPELEEIVVRLTRWLANESVLAVLDLRKPLNLVLRRTVEALPSNDLTSVAERLLSVPILGEAGWQPNLDFDWPEPFDSRGLLGRSVSPPLHRTGDWPKTWTRLIEGMRSTHPERRERSLFRAYFLHANGWLDPLEGTALGDAFWATIDPGTGLPHFRRLRCSLVLRLPQATEHDAAGKLRRYLVGRPLTPWKDEKGAFSSDAPGAFENWLDDLTRVFRPPAQADANKGLLILGVGEATELLRRLLDWWPSAMEVMTDPRWREVPFGGLKPEEIARRFCTALGEVLLLCLPPGSELGAKAEEHLGELAKVGFSIGCAAPGRLFQRADLLELVVADLKRALTSTDAAQVNPATRAITRWRRAASASLLPPVPRALVGTLVSCVMFRRLAGFDGVADCLSGFIESTDEPLDAECESQLLVGLTALADETGAAWLRRKFLEGEIERTVVVESLYARSSAASLAKKLAAVHAARGRALPGVLLRWQEIGGSDALPETRRAWDSSQ